MSRVPAMAWGWLASTPTGWPADAHQRRHQLRRPRRPQLEELAVVGHRGDDLADVVAPVAVAGTTSAQLRRGPGGRVARTSVRRELVAVRGEETEQLVDARSKAPASSRASRVAKPGPGGVHRCAPQLCRAAPARRSARPPPPAPRRTKCPGRHDHGIGQAEQQRRARQQRAVHGPPPRARPPNSRPGRAPPGPSRPERRRLRRGPSPTRPGTAPRATGAHGPARPRRPALRRRRRSGRDHARLVGPAPSRPACPPGNNGPP